MCVCERGDSGCCVGEHADLLAGQTSTKEHSQSLNGQTCPETGKKQIRVAMTAWIIIAKE